MEQEFSKNEQERLVRLKASRLRKIRNLTIWIVVIAAIAGGAYFIVDYSKKAESKKPGQEFPIASAEHIPDGQKAKDFNSNPPTSGQHYAEPANWGIYDEQLLDERLVHNLEHGGIWISYKPDLDPTQIAELKNIADDYTLKVIMTPRPENDSPIVVASWGRLLKLDQADDGQIKDFIKAYINKGPEQVPY